jgi:two-component system sensor histidine kinase KdpD
VESALEIVRRARPTHSFELERDAALPQIEADGDAVDRVVKNLVSNAVKYSSPGSRVGVTVRRLAGAVEIAVEDEGPGLAEAELARVFEPYYRAPGAATAARGTGLGLAVVRSLVEAHGGTVRAENRPAGGARFALRLPVGGPAAIPPRDPDGHPAPSASAGRLN